MEEHEDEIELMDYLKVIWKRKWLIMIPTLLCIIAAGVVSFLRPKVWQIDTIVQPGTFFIENERGLLKEQVVDNPKQIAGQINQAYYNDLIAADLKIDVEEIPGFRAGNLRDTNLVNVSLRAKDIEKAKLILDSLFKNLKRELDAELDIEIKRVDSQIESKELEKLRLETENKTKKYALNMFKKRIREIRQEIDGARKRMEFLEKQRSLNLKKPTSSESESLAMLLYLTEINQSLRYINSLNELLNNKKLEEEDTNLGIKIKEGKIKQIENEIEKLNEEKSRIKYAKMIKEPTSSPSPVAPNMKRNILVTGILSLMIFIVLAFFLEYAEKQKK